MVPFYCISFDDIFERDNREDVSAHHFEYPTWTISQTTKHFLDLSTVFSMTSLCAS